MRRIYLLARITLVATLIVLALTFGDFLALHDIRNEYVSEEILVSLGVRLSSELPLWTATAGEWALVQFSYLARLAFLVITLSLCVMILRKHGQEKEGLARHL